MRHIKLFEAFSSEFYSRGRDAGYVKDVKNPTTERYDILNTDLKKEFGFNTTSKYFAFLVNIEDGKVKSASGANSGQNLRPFEKTEIGKKISAQEFYDKIKDKNVPIYIRESEFNKNMDSLSFKDINGKAPLLFSKARKHPVYKMVEKVFKKFPRNAVSWANATDEMRDMARVAREMYTEIDLDMLHDEHETNPNAPQPLDFRKIKTPSEWNSRAQDYIMDMLDKMSDEAKTQYHERFKHWSVNEGFYASRREEKIDPSAFPGSSVTYSVRYEYRAPDGEHENDTKDFTDIDKAIRFVKEKYSTVEFTIENADGVLANGYVNTTNGDLYGVKTKLGEKKIK